MRLGLAWDSVHAVWALCAECRKAVALRTACDQENTTLIEQLLEHLKSQDDEQSMDEVDRYRADSVARERADSDEGLADGSYTASSHNLDSMSTSRASLHGFETPGQARLAHTPPISCRYNSGAGHPYDAEDLSRCEHSSVGRSDSDWPMTFGRLTKGCTAGHWPLVLDGTSSPLSLTDCDLQLVGALCGAGFQEERPHEGTRQALPATTRSGPCNIQR